MKFTDFKRFKEICVSSKFTGDIMMCGALWLSLTDNQVSVIKDLAIKHAKEYKTLDNGAIQVGMFILK